MPSHAKTESELDNFDDLWGKHGDASKVEIAMNELLPDARVLKDPSLYLQILSQIALAQAVQGKINEAHKTLDLAETQLTIGQNLARTRILLERGRIFQQAGVPDKALQLFKQSYEISEQHKLDFHTINAAHMIAIVATNIAEKIQWNEIAIGLANKTDDEKAKKWLGSLYHNLGQALLEAMQYEQALDSFKKALRYREEEAYEPNIRVAKWAIAKTLRFLNRCDEALTILDSLKIEYEKLAAQPDMPDLMFKLTRGWVYEEFAEVFVRLGDKRAKEFAQLAFDDLSLNPALTDIERLERLKTLR